MTNRTIGTCSICGGRVSEPVFFHSIVPPVPTCESCGAVAASFGPVVPMKPRHSTSLRWQALPTTTVPSPLHVEPIIPWQPHDGASIKPWHPNDNVIHWVDYSSTFYCGGPS